MSKKVKRLYEQFKPESYELKLDLDKKANVFNGHVTMKGQRVGRPSKRLTLHQNGLTITSAKLTKRSKAGSQAVKIDRINHHKGFNEVRLHSKTILYPGAYTLTLEFRGQITKQMTGVYPCSFKHNGQDKQILATQFESHHAREVFPCIDEPEAKATFSLTLRHNSGETALSNMPVISQKVSQRFTTTRFEKSPIMSTYLLAFAVGEIHSVEAKTKSGTLVRTWASVAQPATSLEYANDEAVKILDFYTEYFGIPFPLEKIDQIALPDFESGAMENWGLITYREITLLADADNRSLIGEQYISMVVAHELAHQWFGNLVTMRWWDDLWLNESFASLMEHIALDALHPDWQQWETFTANDVIVCSTRDIYKDVQPVGVDVNHPDEIGTLFDPAIVYAKGGRLLKMLREFIGDDAFRAGLKKYFEKHAYSNTTRKDLWDALSATSNQNIDQFMTPWLEQSGQPVISLKENKGKILATQERFVLDAENDKTLWPIATLADGVDPVIFKDKSVELTASQRPIVLNQHGSGHYIVNYGEGKLKDNVDKAFASLELPSETRISYLNDLLLLAQRGDLPLTEALEVVVRSANEPREAVWSIMSRALDQTRRLVEPDEDALDALKKLRRQVAEPKKSKLGWDNAPGDDPNTKLLRLTVLGWMIGAEDTKTAEEAEARYKEAGSVEVLAADHRSLILSSLMRTKPAEHYGNLVSLYQQSANPEVLSSITIGLTAIKDQKLATKLIKQALGEANPGFVRSQDIFRWYAYLMRSRYTRELAWDWFTTNWGRIYEEFAASKSLDYFVNYSAGPMATVEWQKRFNEFFEPKLTIPALTRSIKVAQAEISARVAWRNRDLAKLKQFLSDYN